jgi:hypothetical protein
MIPGFNLLKMSHPLVGKFLQYIGFFIPKVGKKINFST